MDSPSAMSKRARRRARRCSIDALDLSSTPKASQRQVIHGVEEHPSDESNSQGCKIVESIESAPLERVATPSFTPTYVRARAVSLCSDSSSDAGVVLVNSRRRGRGILKTASSDNFIRRGAKVQDDDVFVSSTPSVATTGLAEKSSSSTLSNTSIKEHAAHTSNDWRAKGTRRQAGSSSFNWRAAPVEDRVDHATALEASTLDPRGYVSAENAQAHFPPSSCVFVANASEDELEVEVTRAFMEYGSCWIKIRRDRRNMPYAFVQYMTNEEAQIAVSKGKNRVILGRPCRTEMADAPRTFYLSRKDGIPLTDDEVTSLIQPFGQIAKIWAPDATTKALQRLADGLFVEFVFYDSGRTAMSNLRDNDLYRFEQLTKTTPTKSPAIRSAADNSEARAFLERYDRDKRSIFAGNLPPGTTATQIKELFGHYGQIVDLSIVSRPSTIQGLELHTFAFVEFENPLSVRQAIQDKNGFHLNGHGLKVTQKNSDMNKHAAGRRQTPDRPTGPRAYAGPDSAPKPPQFESPYPWSPYLYAPPPFMPGIATFAQPYVAGGFYTGSPTYHPHVPRAVEQFGPAPAMAPYFGHGYAPDGFAVPPPFPPPSPTGAWTMSPRDETPTANRRPGSRGHELTHERGEI